MKTILDIESAYESALRSAGLVAFDAVMRTRGGPPTSKHKHRETLPIEIDFDGKPRTMFLKRVFKVPPKHAFWPIFRGGPCRSQPCHEWHILSELEEAGIPAMKRVAFGERRRLGMPTAAFLLVEAAPMAHTLENWLVPGFPKPAPVEKRLRDRLLYELGALVRALHDAGFHWPDIHAKHIFAEPRAAGHAGPRWSFCLIDVERMTRRRRRDGPKVDPVRMPTPPALSRSVMKLIASLRLMRIGRFDAWRLWAGLRSPTGRHAGRRRAGDRLPPSDSVRTWLQPGPEQRPRLNDDYEHPRTVPLTKIGRMIVDERVLPWLHAAGLGRFDDVFRYSRGAGMKKPGLSAYRERIRLELADGNGNARVFYLKRYERPPLWEQLRRMRECGWTRSSGWREMHYIEKLSHLGIPTMRGVAFGQKMKGILERRSFGMTEAVPGQSLEELAAAASSDPGKAPSWIDRQEIIRLLALTARHLHRNGLYHRDLYLSHVFLTRNADGGIVLRMIDLGRMITSRLRRRRWEIKDLAALDYSAPTPLVTRADRLRFLYHYRGDVAPRSGLRPRRDPAARQNVRRTIRRIRGRTRRTTRHDVNRARRSRRGTMA